MNIERSQNIIKQYNRTIKQKINLLKFENGNHGKYYLKDCVKSYTFLKQIQSFIGYC